MKVGRFAAAAVAIVLSGPAQAGSYVDVFSELYIFGDSLSDAGDSLTTSFMLDTTPGTALADPSNTFLATSVFTGVGFPPAPYFNGRFSNGPVFTDRLAADFEAQGKITRNYAFGGSQAVTDTSAPGGFDVPDLSDQIGQFLLDTSGIVGPRPLAVFFFGANDIFSAFQSLAGLTPENPVTEAAAAAQAIGAGISQLAALSGVNDFVLLNLGDLAATPRFNLSGLAEPLATIFKTTASLATEALNAGITAQAAALSSSYNIIEVDVAMQIAQIIGDPTLIGLDDSVFPCGVPVGVTGGGLPILDFIACSPSVSKVFWDDVHPTSAVHAELARITRNAISANVAPIPLPMPAALLGAGLFMLAAVRRRRPCQAAVLQNSGR